MARKPHRRPLVLEAFHRVSIGVEEGAVHVLEHPADRPGRSVKPGGWGPSDAGRAVVRALAQDAADPERSRLGVAVLPASLGGDPAQDLGDSCPSLRRIELLPARQRGEPGCSYC